MIVHQHDPDACTSMARSLLRRMGPRTRPAGGVRANRRCGIPATAVPSDAPRAYCSAVERDEAGPTRPRHPSRRTRLRPAGRRPRRTMPRRLNGPPPFRRAPGWITPTRRHAARG